MRSPAKMGLLWRDYFKNHASWIDHRCTKKGSRFPDFKHAITCECLWIDDWSSPAWVCEELKRTELTSRETNGRDKEFRTEIDDETHMLVSLLKTCAKKKDLYEGSRIHAHILETGLLEENHHLAPTLISMYAKCGEFERAQQLHDEISVKTVDSWNALISGYAQHGKSHRALECIEQMQENGFFPDKVTFVCLLRACGDITALREGKRIHHQIITQGLLEKNTKLGSALMDMYVKCGFLSKAREIHDQLFVRDSISWSILIAGYSQSDQGHEALSCLQEMKNEGLLPDAVTFTCILKACGNIRAINIGKQIHNQIAREGLLEKDIMLGSALVDMYAKCGLLRKAKQVHDGLRVQNVISWSALIAGYAQQAQVPEAFHCFEEMEKDGHVPDAVTFISLLRACGSTRDVEKGRRIHDYVANRGLLEKNISLGTALVDMFVQCDLLAEARQIHDELPIQGLASWNALIAGYAKQGCTHEALDCFERMQREGFSPDAITFTLMAKVCVGSAFIGKGREIHDEMLCQDLTKDVLLGNALMDMYVKCGMLTEAKELHNDLWDQNAVSWNILIGGYAQHRQTHEALKCYEQMKREGVALDVVTFTCILMVCGFTGAIDKGKEIHDEICRRGIVEENVILGTALVDMYIKCGLPSKAQEVHDRLQTRDVVSWSSLIAGYAQVGQGHEALNCFMRMQKEGVSADAICLHCVLNACNHSGLLNEAELYLNDMGRKHGIVPNIDHHMCMVMAFGCVGLFDQAVSLIRMMPCSDYLQVWLPLLNACRKWGNRQLGRLAFNQAIR